MINKERLRKLIDLAVKKGYDEFDDYSVDDYLDTFIANSEFRYCLDLLFDHEFAKAIWGEKDFEDVDSGIIFANFPAYKWHMQQAVVCDNPLIYFWENK